MLTMLGLWRLPPQTNAADAHDAGALAPTPSMGYMGLHVGSGEGRPILVCLGFRVQGLGTLSPCYGSSSQATKKSDVSGDPN